MKASETRPDEPDEEVMISVVVPTYNRCGLLEETLESLLAQEYPKNRYEIIVVDNSSNDGTQEMVLKMQARKPGLIRYFRKENEGPVVSRNFGVHHARGSLIAFTDSDCTVSQRWLAEGARLASEGYTMIQGPTLPKPHQPVKFLSRTVNLPTEHWALPTCNMFYDRQLVLDIGGFNPRMNFGTGNRRPIGCDDAEFGWRARRRGARFAFAPGAIVYHEVFCAGWYEFLVKEPLRAWVGPYALRFIPELRRFMFLRYFFCWYSALFDLLVLGVILALLVHLSFALLAAPYLALNVVFTFKRAIPGRWLPLKLALVSFTELISLAALLYGSIRYRRLLL